MELKINLSQRERLLAGVLYLAIFILLYKFIGGDFDSILGAKVSDQIILFYSGALMIIMGSYLIEPFFTKPTDVIANCLAVIAALLGISDKTAFYYYEPILYFSLLILGFSLFVIAFKDFDKSYIKKITKVFYWIVVRFGSAKCIFSIVYISATYSYFASSNDFVSLTALLTFWVVVVFFDLIGWLISQLSSLLLVLKSTEKLLIGKAIGCENPFLYKIEADLNKNVSSGTSFGDLVAIKQNGGKSLLGMVILKKYLVSQRHLSVYLFRDSDGNPLKANVRPVSSPQKKSVFESNDEVYKVDFEKLEDSVKELLANDPLYVNRLNFAGYVSAGSNIEKINFTIVRDEAVGGKLGEGAILSTLIYGVETIYQVIDGDTRNEHIGAGNSHSFVVGIARKLGHYHREKNELDVVKWLPLPFSPLFYVNKVDFTVEQKKQNAKSFVGHLPDTDMSIPIKEIDSLVTHNTAILGILGIGKSCLTFEAIQKVYEGTRSKVICIDITDEYKDALPMYGCVVSPLNDATLKTDLSTHYEDINKDVHRGGNHAYFRQGMEQLLDAFFKSENRVLIINPDEYEVSKQTNDVKPKKIGPGQNDWQDQAPMADMSLVEKTRIISEIVLAQAKLLGRTKEARCLLVYEEAHSLVPEWNSVATKGDEAATNGISKVVLQGRKYGLGCFIVTQRTANVSKSVLNQANTVFAMRIFDETGINFLENYIGKDYAKALPTLEERHAVVIGKSLKLKQPVIIELNHKDLLTVEEEEE